MPNSTRLNWRRFVSLFLSVMLASSAFAQIEHGTFSVTANGDTPSLSLQSGSSDTVTVVRANRADYHLKLEADDAVLNGAMLTSVAENGASSTVSASSSFDYVNNAAEPDDIHLEYHLSTHQSVSGAELDVDVAFAYFPYNEFISGYAYNTANNAAITVRRGAPASGGIFTDPAGTTGQYTLDLTPIDPTYSSDNGVLIVSAGRNDDNFGMSSAHPDGHFLLRVKDNGADDDLYENDGIGFVYLPASLTDTQIPAFGRISGTGSKIVSSGDFEVEKTDAEGIWHLTIPGHSSETGTLIISPDFAHTGGATIDNLWTYEWDPSNRHWVIEGRDIEPSTVTLQNTGDVPSFSFAFITKSPVYVDASATGANDGSSWENAYTSLWTAANNATAGDQIWVAAGTYLSSQTSDTDDSIELRANVKYYGGFQGNETLLSQRDPYAHETIITGELGNPNDDSDNALHVVTARFQIGGYNVFDGFTISGGRARGEFTNLARGGGIAITTYEPVEIANCRFLDNSAQTDGGAVYVHTDATATFANCTFKGNQAAQGGAVWVSEENRLTFTNCVFQGNYATELGGALVARIADSYTDLINCSFQGNRSGTIGSAIYSETVVNLFNTVVWGNQDGNLTPEASLDQLYRSEGASNTTKYSLVQNLSSPGFGSLINTDPRFFAPIDPAQAPTTEGNLSLRNSSPLIDQGKDSYNDTEYDISAYERIDGEVIDIGAHEASDVFQFAPNVAAAGNGPTDILDWFAPGSIESYENSFTLRETVGDFQVAGGPSVDYENGNFSITLSDTTSAFINYTLTLEPLDGSHAPVHLDFTVKVGPQAIYVDPTSTGSDHSGSSWQNAKPSLAAALEYSISGDNIYVAQGLYTPADATAFEANDRDATFQLQSGVGLYGGFPSGGGELSERVFTEGNASILSGGDILYHVVTGSGTDATAILDGFTISDGYPGTAAAIPNGVGLLNVAGSPTIRNCTFEGNIALPSARGAAICNQFGSSPTIINCRFVENSGPGGAIANLVNSNAIITDCVFENNYGEGAGGAIYNDESNPKISNCLFESNSASQGGAIYNTENAAPTITNCQFIENSATTGGAIYNDGSSSILEDCLLRDNSADSEGGAFYLTGRGETKLVDCDLIGNRSNISGGAIYKIEFATIHAIGTRFEGNFVESSNGGAVYMSAGSALFEDVEFIENIAQSGGAIYAFFCEVDIQQASFIRNRSYGVAGAIRADQGTFDIRGARFLGNRAQSNGGAIDAVKSPFAIANSIFVHNRSYKNKGGAISIDPESDVSLLNASITENRAVQGGAIWAEKAVLLTNSIFWNNKLFSGDTLSHVEGSGGFDPASANNIIQGLPGGFDPLFIHAPDPVDNDIPEDASLINYGNLRLQPDSPAVDAGANPAEPTELDLGGNPRIQNTTIDIGAYEGYRDDYYHLFGHFDPEDDYNHNGYTNWEDYAHGADPFWRHDDSRYTRIEQEDGQRTLIFSHRPNREDVFVTWQQSTTLEPDSWGPLEEGVHYQDKESDAESALEQTYFNLGTPSETPIFYRQVLSQTQP